MIFLHNYCNFALFLPFNGLRYPWIGAFHNFLHIRDLISWAWPRGVPSHPVFWKSSKLEELSYNAFPKKAFFSRNYVVYQMCTKLWKYSASGKHQDTPAFIWVRNASKTIGPSRGWFCCVPRADDVIYSPGFLFRHSDICWTLGWRGHTRVGL